MDTIGYDLNKNGIPDFFCIDQDEDGDIDYSMIDVNENGIPEGMMYEELLDGTAVDIYYFDTDENMEWDTVGIDYEQDGTVDKYAPYS